MTNAILLMSVGWAAAMLVEKKELRDKVKDLATKGWDKLKELKKKKE